MKLLDVKTIAAHQLEVLRDPAYLSRCFVDAGALCWPNGLELSAARMYELSHAIKAAA
jgi:hypothetical protein